MSWLFGFRLGRARDVTMIAVSAVAIFLAFESLFGIDQTDWKPWFAWFVIVLYSGFLWLSVRSLIVGSVRHEMLKIAEGVESSYKDLMIVHNVGEAIDTHTGQPRWPLGGGVDITPN